MVRMKLPIACLIANDAKWEQVKAYFQETGKTPIAVDLASMVRYDKGIEAPGGYGELVEKPEAIRPALDRALTCGRPACLNVMTAPRSFTG